MAQLSYPYTTGTVGDGATQLTEAQLARLFRRNFANGVTGGVGSDLNATVIAGGVQIAPGAAVVDGRLYDSDANETFTIPTPTNGTTGHRIVLRSDTSTNINTGKRVRLTLLSSANGVAALPAIQSTPDSVWDLRLWGITITTGGVITLIDERVYNNLAANRSLARSGGTLSGNLILNNGTADTPDVTFSDPVNNTHVDLGLLAEQVRIASRFRGGSWLETLLISIANQTLSVFGKLVLQIWNNAAGSSSRIYIQSADPGSVPNGSIWIKY